MKVKKVFNEKNMHRLVKGIETAATKTKDLATVTTSIAAALGAIVIVIKGNK